MCRPKLSPTGEQSKSLPWLEKSTIGLLSENAERQIRVIALGAVSWRSGRFVACHLPAGVPLVASSYLTASDD